MRIAIAPGVTDVAERGDVAGLPDDDVLFVPNRPTYEEVGASYPLGWQPDIFVFWHPEGDPVPRGIENAGCYTVGLVGDWNFGGQAVQHIGGAFDLLIADRNGCDKLQALGFSNVSYANLYGFDPKVHRRLPDVERDLDIVMIGNFNPYLQHERARWLARIAQLSSKYRVCLTSQVWGNDYTRMMNRAKIVFNRSIRGEANMRVFEAPACGALLFYERENREIREFFIEGEECVLYGDDDMEELLDYYLTHDEERASIAEAGYQRAQTHIDGPAYRFIQAAKAAFQKQPSPGRRRFRALPASQRTLFYCDQWLATKPSSGLWDIVRDMDVEPTIASHHANRRACVLASMSIVEAGRPHITSLAKELLVYACSLEPGNIAARLNLALLEADSHAAEDQLLAVSVLLTKDVQPRQVIGPYIRRAWDAFAVEVEKAWYSHAVESPDWTREMTSTLQWLALEKLSDLAFMDGRFPLAVLRGRAAVELKPCIGTTRFRLARALAGSGQWEEAVSEYWRMLEQAPMFVEAWLSLLTLLRQMDREAELRDAFDLVHSIVSACPPLAGWKPQLEAFDGCYSQRAGAGC